MTGNAPIAIRDYITQYWDARIRDSQTTLARYRQDFVDEREVYNASSIARMKEAVDVLGKKYEALKLQIIQEKEIKPESYNPLLHMTQAQLTEADRDETGIQPYFNYIYRYESLLPFVRMHPADGDAAYKRHMEESKARALQFLDAHPELEKAGDRILVITSHRCNLSKLYIPDTQKLAAAYQPPLDASTIYMHEPKLYYTNVTDGGYEIGTALQARDSAATPQTMLLRDGKVVAIPTKGKPGPGQIPIGKHLIGDLMVQVDTHLARTPPNNSPLYFETMDATLSRLKAFTSATPNDDPAFLSKKTPTAYTTQEGAASLLKKVAPVWNAALAEDPDSLGRPNAPQVTHAELQAIRRTFNEGFAALQAQGQVQDAKGEYIAYDPTADAEHQQILSGMQAGYEKAKTQKVR